METENALISLVNALRESWTAIFGVDLEIVVKDTWMSQWWSSVGAAVACWTAGQQVEWSILHLGHASYQKFITLAHDVRGPV